MKAIVAVDKNWGIGNKGELLARIPEDQKFFRDMTINKVVVMGRETLESLPGGNPLKDRVNIVMTRNSEYRKENVIIYRSIDELLKGLEEYDSQDIFIIGGESIYRQMLPYCDEIYVTKVGREYEADRFFPELDGDESWEMTGLKENLEYDSIPFGFYLYRRKDK